jgi:hypothetical protein
MSFRPEQAGDCPMSEVISSSRNDARGPERMPSGLLLSIRETIQARAVQSVAGGILAELSSTSPSLRRSKALYDRPRHLPSDEEGSGMRLGAQKHRRMLGNGYRRRPVEMDLPLRFHV